MQEAVVVQPREVTVDGNKTTRSREKDQLKRFSRLVYAGYQLKAKDGSGQSIYEKLPKKIVNS
jgi:hypothetical protein